MEPVLEPALDDRPASMLGWTGGAKLDSKLAAVSKTANQRRKNRSDDDQGKSAFQQVSAGVCEAGSGRGRDQQRTQEGETDRFIGGGTGDRERAYGFY